MGNVTEVKALLDKDVSPNAEDGDGWTPLLKAAEMGEARMCSMLLVNGANPKAAIKLGEWGNTALHFAARHGHRETCEVLAPVSNLKAKNHNGKTAAEIAKSEGHKDLAKYIRQQDK